MHSITDEDRKLIRIDYMGCGFSMENKFVLYKDDEVLCTIYVGGQHVGKRMPTDYEIQDLYVKYTPFKDGKPMEFKNSEIHTWLN